MEARPQHILMLFVDGLGIPPEPLRESVYRHCPAILDLLENSSTPADAALGVPGIPQSATGQTAIFTGINAPARVGGHREGFPNAALRELIERDNLFAALGRAGRVCTFANAYVGRPGSALPIMFRSVTTVMTLAALGTTRSRDDLLAGRAVYHDLTRETLPARGVEDVPPIAEAEAAEHLLGVMRTVDFCLFEYFLTDHAGHKADPDGKQRVLRSLDAFLETLLQGLDPRNELLLMVSDHGNIESDQRRGHSLNPVPWTARGPGEHAARQAVRSLVDVTPAILALARTEHAAEAASM